MLDALLAALPDSAYFKQIDFHQEFRGKLLASDFPFAGCLRGAGIWELSREPGYPVYSIAKTNTENNSEPKVGYGSMVLSSTETGELLIYPMKDESGKMPLANPLKPSRSPSNKPRPKTISVSKIWRTLEVKDMRDGYGEYLAFLHMGGFQSQPYRFQVEPGQENPAARTFESVLIEKGQSLKGGSRIQEVEFIDYPENIPALGLGLTMSRDETRAENGKISIPITASFRFSGSWPEKYERLPLHTLVSVAEVKGINFHTLWLPRSKCRFKDGSYSGRIRFDLADFWVTPWDGRPKLPKQAWISAVHRDWNGPIEKHIFGSSP